MISTNVLHKSRDLMADFITSRRKELGLTQPELAEKAGLGVATIRRIEGKKFIPDGKSLLKICYALDCFFFMAEKESDEAFVQAMRERWRREGDEN